MLHRGASDQYAGVRIDNIFVEFRGRIFQQIVGIRCERTVHTAIQVRSLASYKTSYKTSFFPPFST